jgi:predicted nucleic acid-binding protein
VIVYVETNFLLELAYVQERCESCDEMLELGRVGSIKLVVPTYSAAEARTTWDRRSGERKAFHDELQRQVHQLSRSQPFRALRDSSRELTSALAFSGQDTRDRLERAIENLFTHGQVLELTQDVVFASREYEHRFALTPPDALVLASVLSHASTVPAEAKCFVSQDVKGFANPNIYDELAKYRCKMLANFTDAVAYVRNHLSGAG